MVETVYGFVAVSAIAWIWLALMYWFLTCERAQLERRVTFLERKEAKRKREEQDEKSWKKHISPSRTTTDMKVKT
jgi:Flp pilus assembly protein TadB